MGKIGSRYVPWYYWKESLEQFKNKSVPDCLEARNLGVFSYSNDQFMLKYLREY